MKQIVRGQLSDDVLGILVHTAEQRRADPVLVPQSNEAKAWRGGDDAAAVLGIAFGSEHRQLNPSEIRTEAGAPDNRRTSSSTRPSSSRGCPSPPLTSHRPKPIIHAGRR